MPRFLTPDHKKHGFGLVIVALFFTSFAWALMLPMSWGGALLALVGASCWWAGKRQLGVALLLPGLACAFAGWQWAQWQIPLTCKDHSVWLTGRVIAFPEYLPAFRGSKIYRMTVRVSGVESELCGQPSQVIAYVTDSMAPPVLGSTIRLFGQLRPPPGQWNYGSLPDQARWLAKGLHARMRVTDMHILPPPPGTLARVRSRVAEGIDRLNATARVKGLLHALSLGNGSRLPSDDWLNFRRLGVSHMAVISGLHLGLVFLLTWRIGGRLLVTLCPRLMLRRDWALLPSLGIAAGYAALAGFSLPTLRALLMLGGLVLLRLMGCQTASWRILLLAAGILLCCSPFTILGSSFWLSVGATGAVLFLSELDRGKPLASHSLSMWRLLKLQAGLLILLAPLTLFWFGEIYPVAVAANLFLLPIVSSTLVPLVLIGMLWFLLAGSPLNPAWLLAAEVASGTLSATHYVAERIPSSWVVQWRRLWRRPVEGLELVVLDVGQGLAVVIHTPTATLVYDTGDATPSGFTQFDKVLLPYLRWRGIEQPALWVISHGDRDHAGGLPVLKERFPGAQLMGFGGKPCRAGQWLFARDDVTLRVLNGPGDSNDGSCVLKLAYRGFTALLAGDVSAVRERQLIRYWRDELRADVLVVGHHGSKTSTGLGFLKWVKPSVALISAGPNNRFGHPHSSVTARLEDRRIDIHRTDKSAAISVQYRPDGLLVQGLRDGIIPYWLRTP